MRGRTEPILIASTVIAVAIGALTVLTACGSTAGDGSQVDDPVGQVPTVAPTLPATDSPPAQQPSPAEPLATEGTTPTPFVHIVEAGDTLYGIALAHGVSLDALLAANDLEDPDLLRVGQRVVVPVLSPDAGAPVSTSISAVPTKSTTQTPEARATPEPLQEGTAVPSPTSSGPPVIEIAQVLGSSILGEETVVIRNRGGVARLERWSLAGGQGGAYTFPDVTVYQDSEVRLHSRSGTSSPTDLYWGRVEPAWQAGELITLRDASGEVVDTYIVP
jgi:LysM repeat protein